MLAAKDYTHVGAQDWARIAAKALKLKDGEKLLLAVSDEHSGGVTSCMPEVKHVLAGFAQHANIMLLNGDDFEYESPTLFTRAMQEVDARFPQKTGPTYRLALIEAAERVLHEKVAADVATLTALIKENPHRQIVKVIGNHENFTTFRDALTQLEQKFPNFQWTPEVAVIPMPGNGKDTRDRLLAVHGDLQMDDLWFVEEGGTDKERKLYTHRDMAEKVVNIATSYWAPSAQKQEKGQGVVNWWRKPNATAKTLYTELLFRAQEGDFHQAVKKNELKMDRLDELERRLKKRHKKFQEFAAELEQRTDLPPDKKEAEALVYRRSIEHYEKKLEQLHDRAKSLDGKSSMLLSYRFKSPRTILHYKKLGESEAKVFTSKQLERATHINYGHTHVSAEAVEIDGANGDKKIVSNNASVTGAIMCKPLDDKRQPRKLTKHDDPDAVDLGNLGALVYRVNKEGKITAITSLGRVLCENLNLVKQMLRDVPKPPPQPPETEAGLRLVAINPEHIARKKTGQQDDHGVA